MKRIVLVVIASATMCASPGLAQQEKGDKEIGLDGAATISNSNPVNGNVFGQLSFGRYLQRSQYIGVYAAPQFSFSGGDTSGGFGVGGEYRFLLGHKNARVWPFIGGQGGEALSRAAQQWSHREVVAPEFGVKFYASQKTAFEVSYLFMIQFNGGASYSSFFDRTQNFVVFGFKHLF